MRQKTKDKLKATILFIIVYTIVTLLFNHFMFGVWLK